MNPSYECPVGLCDCGCGQKTTLARQTDAKRGYIRGEPKRYIIGHRGRMEVGKSYRSVYLGNGKSDYEHRRVYTFIPKGFHVHHIDGNRRNNSPDNLKVLSPREHLRLHQGWYLIKGKWFKQCSRCKRTLEVNKDNFWFRSTGKVVYLCKQCANKNRNTKHAKS